MMQFFIFILTGKHYTVGKWGTIILTLLLIILIDVTSTNLLNHEHALLNFMKCPRATNLWISSSTNGVLTEDTKYIYIW